MLDLSFTTHYDLFTTDYYGRWPVKRLYSLGFTQKITVDNLSIMKKSFGQIA